MGDKITLDRETFKALAADTRIEMLKALHEHKLTLTDLSERLEMSPSTIKEHLDRLLDAGLIVADNRGMKWKYYRLTSKGENIVTPVETRVWILLATSTIMFLAGGGVSVFKFLNSSIFQAKSTGSLDASARMMPKAEEYMVAASEEVLLMSEQVGDVASEALYASVDTVHQTTTTLYSMAEQAPAIYAPLQDPVFTASLVVVGVSLLGMGYCLLRIAQKKTHKAL
jgi:DNA-binding transcriptional ArsR family regulator